MKSVVVQKLKRAKSSVLVRMVLFVAALLILTAGLMSWAGYVVARSIIRDQIHERLRVAASDRHQMVLSFVDQQLERVGLVASRTRLRTLIAQFQRNEILHEELLAGTRPILEDALASTEGFLDIRVTDPAGRVLTASNEGLVGQSFEDDPAFQAGLERRHLGMPRRADGTYVTLISAPARSHGGELLGVVLVRVDVSRLYALLSRTHGLGETGEVLVGTRQDDAVRYLFPPRRQQDRMAALDSVPAMAAAIGGAAGSEVTEYAGARVLVHFRPIAYQPLDYRAWGLVAKMDVLEAYAPLGDFARGLALVHAGLVAIGLGLAFWLSRRLTRPIRRLTESATAVAQGDLSVQVEVKSDDEIGTLARTFNAMTRELQSSYTTLEDRVRRRTAELSSEVARREEVQEELEQNAERIQRIIDTANDAFIAMNDEGLIVEWNPQAESMFGWSRDEVLQRPLAETVIPEEFREEHRQGLQRFLKTREARVLNRRLELTALRRDGSRFPVELTITPQRLNDQFVFNAFLHDITRRKAGELELREAREVAESANQSKSEFLANMSHEIRTPMNGIIGMAELLASTPLEPDQREYLNMVKQSADSLLRLLNDILDFSKIEAGKLELETIPFSLRDCIGNTGHTLSSRAADKGIELACRIAPQIPDILIGDPGRLRQIIVNLVGNAIKFTDEGEVVVEVVPVSTVSSSTVSSSFEEDSNDSHSEISGRIVLRISVRDTGIGIPPEKQKLIFEAFGQADTSTTRQFGGTGLGLAISAQLVDMMGGEIDVESQVGEGTTFFFTAEFGIARRQKLRRPGDLAALQGTPVLVVDDNETNRRILHEILESWNLHPLTAASGTEGLQLIEESRARGQSIPLVLLDCMMPDMDGFDFAGKLRETVCSEECTLIMVSSAIQVGDSERCRQRQIARCMAKPVKHSELLNAILIEFHQEPEGEPDEETALFHADDVQPRRVLLAEDGLVNQRVAIGFLKQRGHQVEVAADGREAVDAVSREPFDVVLMDVQMPEMDGFAATSAIRRQERGTGRHLPIIAMTANAMKGDRERCLEAGMDDYVSKPVDPAALFKAVESAPAGVLADENVGEQPAAEQKPDDAAEQKPEGPAGQKPDGAAEGKSEKKPVAAEPHARPRSAHARPRSEHARPRSEEETAAAESARELDQPSTAVDAETGSAAGTSSAGSGDGDPRKTPPAETTGQLIDWEATTQRMPGGEKVARDMAGMLREEAPKCLAQIRQAQQERDAETLRRAAHTLKGSLAIFELDDMVVLSEEMESYGKAGDFGAAGKLLPGMEAAVSRLTDELAGYVESS